MNINEKTLREFRDEFANAMLDLENKFGLAIEIGNISYNPAGFYTKLEVKNLNDDGRAMIDPIKEKRAFYAISAHLGRDVALQGPIIGKNWILTNGNTVHLEDYNSKSHKYPFVYWYNGQRYKCSVRMIKERSLPC